MQIINLYSDYEGYGEIVLTEETSSHEVMLEVRLLDFHFTEVLSQIPLGRYHTDSVMFNYLEGEGWFYDKWECKRTEEFYLHLLDIQNMPDEYGAVHDALLQICQSALKHSNQLFIEKE
jgi:hypothetical protein